ncbi:MAG: hypothetical protein MH137_00120 [Flavobacteriales bacterium]|nr:hypothetical protein [Flavobacteriales bacterium]
MHIKQLKTTATIFLLFIFIGVHAQKSKSKWATYKDKEWAFSMKYPANWEKKLAFRGTQIAVVSPKETPQDDFNENFNLVINPNTDISLKDVVQLTLDQVPQSFEEGKTVSSEILNGKGGEYGEIIFSGMMNDKKLIWYQRILKKGNTLFILTFTMAEEAYGKYRPTASLIFDSFKVSKKN